MTAITLNPIGIVETDVEKVPRHWTISDAEGRLVIQPEFTQGLRDIEPGQRIAVIFHFHRSPPFSDEFLIQNPPHHKGSAGVFSICSPIRPNPLGLSVLRVLRVEGNVIHVRGLDMMSGTPVLDIKPYIEAENDRP
jgi:tRNA (adenine37-N6)-methyltransferase